MYAYMYVHIICIYLSLHTGMHARDNILFAILFVLQCHPNA